MGNGQAGGSCRAWSAEEVAGAKRRDGGVCSRVWREGRQRALLGGAEEATIIAGGDATQRSVAGTRPHGRGDIEPVCGGAGGGDGRHWELEVEEVTGAQSWRRPTTGAGASPRGSQRQDWARGWSRPAVGAGAIA